MGEILGLVGASCVVLAALSSNYPDLMRYGFGLFAHLLLFIYAVVI